jgi:VanZ family protein
MLWAALILVLTSVPHPPVVGPDNSDKAVHFIVYFVLGLLWIRPGESRGRPWIPALVASIAILCFAAVDELHQLLIPGRFASLTDWFADAAGAGAGVVFSSAVAFRRKTI